MHTSMNFVVIVIVCTRMYEQTWDEMMDSARARNIRILAEWTTCCKNCSTLQKITVKIVRSSIILILALRSKSCSLYCLWYETKLVSTLSSVQFKFKFNWMLMSSRCRCHRGRRRLVQNVGVASVQRHVIHRFVPRRMKETFQSGTITKWSSSPLLPELGHWFKSSSSLLKI